MEIYTSKSIYVPKLYIPSPLFTQFFDLSISTSTCNCNPNSLTCSPWAPNDLEVSGDRAFFVCCFGLFLFETLNTKIQEPLIVIPLIS